MTATSRARQAEFEPIYHHYGPHRAGLPPLIPYFRELWHRRAFAAEMSRATMRGANTSTFFGQAWLILNPLLLAAVYYILVTIIRRQNDPAFFAHLTLGMFAFQLVGTSITSGATSVTSSGKLLLNTPFPRLLIPLSAVRTAFFRFLPTVPVYFVFHAIFLTHVWSPKMLLSLYFLGTMVVFAHGPGGLLCGAPGLLPRYVELSAVLRADLDVLVPDPVGTRTRDRPILRTDHDAHPAQPDVFHDRRLHRAFAERRVPHSVHVDISGGVGARGRGDRLLVLHLEGA